MGTRETRHRDPLRPRGLRGRSPVSPVSTPTDPRRWPETHDSPDTLGSPSPRRGGSWPVRGRRGPEVGTCFVERCGKGGSGSRLRTGPASHTPGTTPSPGPSPRRDRVSRESRPVHADGVVSHPASTSCSKGRRGLWGPSPVAVATITVVPGKFLGHTSRSVARDTKDPRSVKKGIVPLFGL